MKTADLTIERLRDLLTDLASRSTGFRKDSFHTGAIEKIIRGTSLKALAQAASEGSPELLSRLGEAVPVGETYFFRQPEHFQYLLHQVLPSRPPGPLKVWSAGCATGEEAYSLAACLASSKTLEGVELEILGTDLSQDHLETARKGVYGPWSLRGDKEELYPVFERSGRSSYSVKREIKDRTRFLQHNLLQSPPEGPFDIIFCRNVLVYFTPEAARVVLRNLSAALSPEGLLFLGPADIPAAPAGFKLQGPPELSIYQKGSLPRSRGAAPRKAPASKASLFPFPRVKKKASVGGKTAERTGPVTLHLQVLEAMEKEDHPEAGRQLEKLRQSFPDYLPGLYESALWNARNKKRALAQGLMKEILRRLKGKEKGEVLTGPQDLTVDFYRVSARIFLDRTGT